MSRQINPQTIKAFAEIAQRLGATEFTICGDAQGYYSNYEATSYEVPCTCNDDGDSTEPDPECPAHGDYYGLTI